METQILKQGKNPFLHREEILMEIQSEATPSFEEVKKELGKDAELTVVKKVEGNFGTKTFHADVVVYENAESKKEVETLHKNQKKKEEAPAPAPAPAPTETAPVPAEAPVEQPVEEKTAEETIEVKEEKQEDGN